MNIRNTFQDNNIITLSETDFSRLMQDKVLHHPSYSEKNHYRISSTSKGQPTSPIDWPVMVYKDEATDVFFQAQKKKNLDDFLRNSFLAHYNPESQTLKTPASGMNLEQMLLESFHRFPQLNKIDFKNKKLFQDNFINQPVRRALLQLLKNEEFKGMLTCCECGVTCCSSEYVWIKDGICLFYTSVMAAGINEIKLFPFNMELEKEMQLNF